MVPASDLLSPETLEGLPAPKVLLCKESPCTGGNLSPAESAWFSFLPVWDLSARSPFPLFYLVADSDFADGVGVLAWWGDSVRAIPQTVVAEGVEAFSEVAKTDTTQACCLYF